jgi:uncharacterized protein YndB with AHSA1/START domain
MRSIDVSRIINTPRSAVWAVLSDFPNIADWNTGVKRSFSTSDAGKGVGATRHCDLTPIGELEETIAEWIPDERLVVHIDSATKLPLKSAIATFTLAGDDSTTASINYTYEPRFGPIGAIMGPILDRQFRKGFTGFLVDLAAAAQNHTSPPSTD